jgi:outer membrane protein OmpA-like peptidoglycan-associated protein
MVFGASLLGVATTSCVPEPRSAQAPAKPVLSLHDGADRKPTTGNSPPASTESAPNPSATGTKPSAPSATDEARPPSSVVAIYGGSSVAIHDEVEYTRNSLVIDGEGERTLAALKELLEAFDCDVLLQGHAGRDEAKAAEWLSKRRAELVRDRLIALGVDSSRLSVETRTASLRRETRPRAPGRDRSVSFVFHAKANSSRVACEESDRRKP